MAEPTNPESSPSPWWRRVFLAPGVLLWGLPTAVTTAIWVHGSTAGWAWQNFLSTAFLVQLLVFFVAIGLIGGRMFGAVLARRGVPLERRDRPPSA